MTLLPNGRPATQSDIAAIRSDISDLRRHLDIQFGRYDSRIRALEIEQAADDGEERATAAAQSTKRVVQRDSLASRRWRVGIAIGVISVLFTNIISLAALIR